MAANDDILDASVTHQVELQFYNNGVVRRMLATLNRVDADLFSQLQVALDKLPQSRYSTARIEKVLASVRRLNADVYAELSSELQRELKGLAEYEVNFQKQLFDNTLPITSKLVNAEQVYTAALARPFQGRLLKEWMAGLEVDRSIRIRDAVRMGYVEGQTVGQIVQRIRGTRALKYNDGMLDITRRNAETIVRTALSHTASFARDRFFQANEAVIKALKWSATLDGRTTQPCRARDGKRYTLDHKPIGHSLPWGGGAGNYHFGCRSVAVAISKSWKELGIDADELSPSTRASINGQVPDDVTYGDWLKKKPAKFQDEVLGNSKGKLFRAGLKIDRFSNNKGHSFTLDELKARDSALFEKAGL